MSRLLAILLAAALLPSSVAAVEIESVCIDSVVASLASNPNPSVRFVFVRFPQVGPWNEANYDSFPKWADPTAPSNWLTTAIDQFVLKMSHGQQTLSNVQVVVDPDHPWRPWTADHEADYYVDTYVSRCGSGVANPWARPQEINLEIMRKIDQRLGPNYWAGVNFVFVYMYDNAFGCRYTVGGASWLGVYSSDFPGFYGGGSTLHLFVRQDRFPVRDSFATSENWAAAGPGAHEYGHALGFGHSPYSGHPDGDPPGGVSPPCGQPQTNPDYVNIGRYDLMRAFGPPNSPALYSIEPYHIGNLVTVPAWLPDSLITSDVRRLHVAEVRNVERGKAYRVATSDPTHQWFWFSNHQAGASSVYDDSTYVGATGLLIWHALKDGFGKFRAWDLETARNKVPNAVSGKDPLESDWCDMGTADDFFDGRTDSAGAACSRATWRDFTRCTNPNTNRYASLSYQAEQSVPTSIAFENIHKDPYSTDILVDVFVDPKQYISFPRAGLGDFIPKGSAWATLWDVRPKAGIRDSVDISVLDASGQPVTTWLNQSNAGYFTLAPFTSAGQYRVRLLSHDPLTSAADTSVALTVWEVTESSVEDVVSYSCDAPTLRLEISWDTSVSTDGTDVVWVYPPGQSCGSGTYTTASHASYGTHHEVVWTGQCQTGTWSYVVKSNKGGGIATSSCKTRTITQCASCPPPCRPSCEFE